jgi:(p)ppGpp synthase/HD superfamily hydrolase
MQPSINYTLDLIRDLHEGQTDHSGKPYVAHPIRVARNVRAIDPQASDDVVMAAMLHDTIEDCGIDDNFLRQKGYSEECIAIVNLVTKPENDPRSYDQVIDDLVASGNRGAMLVKLADNMDNLHPERVTGLKQSNSEKAERLGSRYRASIERLCAATGIGTEKVYNLINDAPKLEVAGAAPS